MGSWRVDCDGRQCSQRGSIVVLGIACHVTIRAADTMQIPPELMCVVQWSESL